MAEINLDAARAARAETEREPHTLTFGGKQFGLPDELPFTFAEAAATGAYRSAMMDVLGEEQGAEFFALTPTLDDVIELVSQLAPLYTGNDLPKSSGSGRSSKNTSKDSKQPSRTDTA